LLEEYAFASELWITRSCLEARQWLESLLDRGRKGIERQACTDVSVEGRKCSSDTSMRRSDGRQSVNVAAVRDLPESRAALEICTSEKSSEGMCQEVHAGMCCRLTNE
jgi:hypothetical protein